MNKHAYLKDVILQSMVYDGERGVITWTQGLREGKEAGSVWGDGYRYIQFQNRHLLGHRVAWLLYHGEWPQKQLDHINTIRSDNRISNLREATYSQNGMNRGIQVNNKLGFKGVTFHKPNKSYVARIRKDGKVHILGYYATPEDAGEAYKEAAKVIHGEFAGTV